MNAKELLEIGKEMENEFPARAARIVEAAKRLENFEITAGVVICAYCGTETDRDDKSAIFQHITTCEKRPEKKLLKKAFEVEDRLYGWLNHLATEKREGCEICVEIDKALKIYNSTEEAE